MKNHSGSIYFTLLYVMLSATVLAIMVGCSSKSVKNLITPSYDFDKTTEIPLPANVSTGDHSSVGLLGVYDLSLDTRSMMGEIVPLRYSNALGDSYVVDITSFLNIDPCPDCVRVRGVELEMDGTLTVRIGARHPFPLPADMSNLQWNDRLDLHVFDVQGILVLDGDITFDSTTSDIAADGIFDEPIVVSADILRNADGYTSIFSMYFDGIYPTQANIHPYRIFALDGTSGNYNPTYDPVSGFPFLDNPMGHNVFRQGSPEYVVEYNLDLMHGEHYNFIFALSASYGQSAQGRGGDPGRRLRPKYFLPEFHRKEPWKIDVNVLDNNLRAYTPTTSAEVSIEIYDWQHTANVDPGFDAWNSNLTMTSQPSRVKEVTVEIPSFGIWMDMTNLPTLSGNGSWGNPLKTTISLNNSALVSEGVYYGLVTARDDMEGSETIGGIERDGETPFMINDYSAYQVFRLDVMPADNPPIPVIITDPDPPFVNLTEPVSFDASASTDDGVIILYEWDFDYAGSGTDFRTYTTGAFATIFYPVPGHYTVALRVTDNHTPSQKAIATVDVIIYCNDEPVNSCSHVSNAPELITTSLNSSWTKRDGKVDFGFLSNGEMVFGDNKLLGRANVTQSGGAIFYPFSSGYPGVNIGLVEVDRQNNVIWVEYKDETKVIIGSVQTRNENRDNRVRVFSTTSNTEIANITLSQYGSYIQAVTIDEFDNVWVMMEDNKIIRLRASDYKPVRGSLIKLNEVVGHDMGFVFGMAKNFHNDCFYVLTNRHDKGSLYRFECDLTYRQSLYGNPNPMEPVFNMVGGFTIIEMFGDDALADIAIDNYADAGYDNILTGQQDCQIVMVACGLSGITQILATRTVARADLAVIARSNNPENSGYGTHAIGIRPDGSNQLYSIVYGNEPYLEPGCSDNHVDIYSPPNGWQ